MRRMRPTAVKADGERRKLRRDQALLIHLMRPALSGRNESRAEHCARRAEIEESGNIGAGRNSAGRNYRYLSCLANHLRQQSLQRCRGLNVPPRLDSLADDEV